MDKRDYLNSNNLIFDKEIKDFNIDIENERNLFKDALIQNLVNKIENYDSMREELNINLINSNNSLGYKNYLFIPYSNYIVYLIPIYLFARKKFSIENIIKIAAGWCFVNEIFRNRFYSKLNNDLFNNMQESHYNYKNLLNIYSSNLSFKSVFFHYFSIINKLNYTNSISSNNNEFDNFFIKTLSNNQLLNI